MKWKDDLSGGERYAWATLIATGIVGFHFYDRMFDGLSVADLGAGDLMAVYLRVIFMFIILHIVIAIVFAIKRKKTSDDGDIFERDERDNAIERKGERAAFWVLAVFVEIVIPMLLFENAYPESYAPFMSVTSPSGMFFALMSAVLAADFISRAIMIRAYRS